MDDMAPSPCEDQRGVDLAQIKQRLRLTPSERVDQLLHEVNTWTDIKEYARRRH